MDALWTPYGRDRRAWHLACLNISETYLCMPGQVVRVARAGKRRAAAGCRLIFSGARPVARYTADPLDCRLRPRVPRLAASCCWQPAGNLLATRRPTPSQSPANPARQCATHYATYQQALRRRMRYHYASTFTRRAAATILRALVALKILHHPACVQCPAGAARAIPLCKSLLPLASCQ